MEESYRQKCKEIKKRIVEIENSNDLLAARIGRAGRAILRMRLERAYLLEQLERRTDVRVDDSDGSPSPPPTVPRWLILRRYSCVADGGVHSLVRSLSG